MRHAHKVTSEGRAHASCMTEYEHHDLVHTNIEDNSPSTILH